MAQAASYGDPAGEVRAITPSDVTDLTGCRGILVGGAGDIAVKTPYGASATTAVTITSVPAGTILPLRVTAVMSTNTTATAIFGFFS